MKYIILSLSICFFAYGCVFAEGTEALTWEDCVKEAAKNNPDLVSAQESVNSAKADKAVSASGLFPQVTSQADISKSKDNTSNSSDSSNKAQNSYSYGVGADQLIFDGFKTVNNVNAASEKIIAARQTYEFTSSEVRLRLRSAFVALMKAQAKVRIKEEIFGRRRQNFELVTLRYEAGRENKGSLLTEEANLKQAKFEVVQAERNAELARAQLAKELGRRSMAPITAKGDLKVKDAVREKPDFAALAGNNPSLKQMIAQKNAAAFNLQSAKGDFLPQISASGNAGKSASDWPPKDSQWSIGAAVSFPVFEGGKRIANVSKAKALLSKAVSDEKSKRDSLVELLQEKWISLQNAVDNIEVQEQFLTAAEERAKITEAQYLIGFVSFNDWIIIEDNLVDAKNSYLNARAQALISEADWIQAKGETLENVE